MRVAPLIASLRFVLSFPAGSPPDGTAFVGISLGEPRSPKGRPRSLRLSGEVLLDLEAALNEPRFMDVPIGSTLADFFTVQFYNGLGVWTSRKLWADRLRLPYHFLKGLRREHRSSEVGGPSPERRILLTLVHDHPRFRELVLPVAKGLGPENCNLFVSTNSGVSSSPVELNCFGREAISAHFDPAEWRREIVSCFPRWRRKLREVLETRRVPGFVAPRLLDAMLLSSQYVAACKSLLAYLRPDVVVTDFDRNSKCSGLVLGARSLGIPSVTLIHGVINPPYSYVPLLADVACCWGELSRQQLVDMGTDPERLIVTGYHRDVTTPGTDLHEVRRRAQIADDRPVVVWASNPIETEMRRTQVRTFCRALAGRQDIAPLVRLHPSEKLETYDREVSEFPTVQFSRASEMTVGEILGVADVVVSHNSGLGNEALIAGKPVVVLDAIDAPLGNAEPLIERAGCPHVRSAEELERVILRILRDGEWRQELRERGRAFVSYQFAAFGDEALQQVLGVIRERASMHV